MCPDRPSPSREGRHSHWSGQNIKRERKERRDRKRNMSKIITVITGFITQLPSWDSQLVIKTGRMTSTRVSDTVTTVCQYSNCWDLKEARKRMIRDKKLESVAKTRNHWKNGANSNLADYTIKMVYDKILASL